MKFCIGLVAGCLALSTSNVEAAPQKRKAPVRRVARPATPPFNPLTYATSVADIDCSNVIQRYQTAVPFEKVARSIISKDAGAFLTKDEFETTEAFRTRATATYRA